MFLRKVLLVAIFMIATGCAEKPESPQQQTTDELAQKKVLALFQVTNPFTLKCTGKYSLLIDDKSSTGTQSFKLSVSPEQLAVYMFDLDADGYIHGPHKDMNETITKIDEVSAGYLIFGSLKIDRNTLKYTAAATAGKCQKLDTFIPIPSHQI